MAAMLEDLLELDRTLANGTGQTYRRICDPSAIFVMPGMLLDLDECAAAVDSAERWDEVTISDGRLQPIDEANAAVIYTFAGRRGDTTYRAYMSSVYRLTDTPTLIMHQHTPIP